MSRSKQWIALGGVVSALVAGVTVWAIVAPQPGHQVPALTVEGISVAVNSDRTAIVVDTKEPIPDTFQESSGGFRAGFELGGATMVGDSVVTEECLPPGSSGQEVRLGIVYAAPGDGPGGAAVIWYECLGLAGEVPE